MIDLVVVRLQTVILSEWIKIKEFIINEEEIDEKQTNMDDIFGIDIYTKLVENTEIAIKNFEDQIETFSYVNKHVNNIYFSKFHIIEFLLQILYLIDKFEGKIDEIFNKESRFRF